ncbi:hypothetical protein GQX73_g1433 [Xylaria multiplex]|uniref:Mid2 domain-containing protein n=1 Tax=Xylaria multiplex TaxID=323545 RepID=A0A7C8MUV8_9PEZI|nr:hypothetical protein GQX73_g1433 [Xylaria multiplex]
MTTPATTPSPTLPADWIPTSSGCLRTDDYWRWEYDAEAFDARTVLGGPSQTTNCFASTWNPTITYAGSGCPPQYTSACQNANFGAVTCCPTAYDFSCQPETWSAGVHGEWFRCQSAYDSRAVMTLTRTDFQKNTLGMETNTRQTWEHLFALALMYTTPTSTSETTSLPTSSSEPTATSTPSTPSENTSSGLSAGAAAGIGVGATAAVIILALLLWFLYRRKRTSKQSGETAQFLTPGTPMVPPPMAPTPATSVAYTYTTEGSYVPSQYLSQSGIGTPPPKEPPRELPAHQEPVFELYGDLNRPYNRPQ